MVMVTEIYKRNKVLIFLSLICFAVYALHAMGWPLNKGRDFGSYITYYLQTFMPTDKIPLERTMLKRSIGFPIFLGGILEMGGLHLLEFMYCVLFVLSVVLMYCIGEKIGKFVGVATCALILSYPSFCAIFHFVSSESLCFFLLVLLLFTFQKFVEFNKYKFAIICGILAGVVILVKPVHMLLITFAPCFLIFSKKRRMQNMLCFIIPIICIVFSYSSYKSLRFGYFGVSNHTEKILFINVFNYAKLVKPENGPYSQRLAKKVEEKLLTKPPYIAKGETINTFFKHPSTRKQEDLDALAVEFFPEEKFYNFKVAIEGILSNPQKFIAHVMIDIINMFFANWANFYPESEVYDRETMITDLSSQKKYLDYRINDYSEFDIGISAYGAEYYLDKDISAKLIRLETRKHDLYGSMPNREPVMLISKYLNILTSFFPSMGWFLLAGIFGLMISKNRSYLLFTFILLCVGHVIFSIITIHLIPHYRILYDPFFILFGVYGFIRPKQPSIYL